jgi:hypothetical protein
MDPAKDPPPPRAAGQPAPPRFCGGFAVSSAKNGGLDVKGVTLAYLCTLILLNGMDRDLIDKTGIAGLLDIHPSPIWPEAGTAEEAPVR